MTYKVFDHMQGSYTPCGDEQHARDMYTQHIAQWVASMPAIPAPELNQPWHTDHLFAIQCYETFWGEAASSSAYSYTVFDIENEVTKCRCFRFNQTGDTPHTGNRLIKVDGTTFLEAYEIQPYDAADPLRFSYSFDLVTKAPLFKYEVSNNVYRKYDAVTNELLADTIPINQLPSQYDATLSNYPDIAATMFQCGPRPYGYIVEYFERPVAVQDASAAAAWLAEGKSRTNVILETQDVHGVTTTVVVDTKDW